MERIPEPDKLPEIIKLREQGLTYQAIGDRIRANTLVNQWCREVGLQGKFETYTLRKTLGYRARKLGVPIELIQEKLGHRSPAVTRRYIGVTQDEVSNIEEKVCL